MRPDAGIDIGATEIFVAVPVDRAASSQRPAVKNVPVRRTDVCDCQWLQFLHSVGLLKASYRPAQEVCAV